MKQGGSFPTDYILKFTQIWMNQKKGKKLNPAKKSM
jgi:hypothetical protein